MSKINDAKLIAKYLSKQDIDNLQTLSNAIKENNIVVTCLGLYNHGKSSLLNVLVGDLKNLTFKTADTRETTENKKVKYKNLTFVDTPGLNAQKNDDKRVMDAVKESDINIFVHNINTGEFVAKEIEFFHTIKTNWENPKDFISRTIFVLSRIDEANSDEDIKNTAIRMKQQIKEVFSIEATLIPASAMDYIDGIVENEDELVASSNITILLDKLSNLSDKIKSEIIHTKKVRLEQYQLNLIQKFESKLQEELLELHKLKREKKKIDDAFKKDISRIESTLKQKYEALEEI